MAVKFITLNEDHLNLIANLKFEEFNFGDTSEFSHLGWGIDKWNMFGGTFVLEDIAMIIGKYDQYIYGTEEDSDGRKFPPELEEYMWGLYTYIWENLIFIESLIHQFVIKGGLTSGTYKCIDYELIWEKVK